MTATLQLGLITTGYPHRDDPVSGAFVREMACALAARGHRIDVLCAERPRDVPIDDPGVTVSSVRYLPPFATHGTFHDEGAPDRLRRGDPMAWFGALTFPLAAIRAARDRLAHCDALISHFVLPCAPIAAMVRGSRPHLAFAHGTDARLLARLPAFMQQRVLDGCTVLRMTHTSSRNALATSVRDDPCIRVAPMGWRTHPIDSLSRDRKRAELLRDGETVLAVTVARAVPVKGLDALCDAAAKIMAPVRVIIAGDGPERARLEPYSPRNVTWLGAVDARRRDALLQSADLFVLPSRMEDGAPVALLEAMGTGRAVVASRTPGIAEIAGDAAVLVECGDARALAEAITRLALDPGERATLGRRACERVARWHWDTQAAEIEVLLTGG